MNVENLVGQAFQAFNQGDNENALHLYQEALSIDPQCLQALRGCASVFTKMRNFEAAINFFTQAIEVDPHDVGSFALRSAVYLQLSDFENALSDSSKAIELEPDKVELYRIRATALLQLKRHSESLQCFQQILQFEPQDKEALEAVGILSDIIINERLLPPLEDIANKIDDAFQPFDEERNIFDEERKNIMREIIIPISDRSSDLVKDILLKDTPLEVLLVYSYIQAVSRGCGAIRSYGVDAGKERLDESKKFFKQSLDLAERLEDAEMMKRIHLKLGAIMLSLYKTWKAKECISDASTSYKWLNSHTEILSADEEESLNIRLLNICDIVESIKNPPSPDTDDIDSHGETYENSYISSKPNLFSKYFNNSKQITLGVGALGIFFLIAGQWLIGLACLGYVWYSWQGF